MLAEDECQAESTDRATSSDRSTVGKLSTTDYRSWIIIMASSAKSLQMILTEYVGWTVYSNLVWCSLVVTLT